MDKTRLYTIIDELISVLVKHNCTIAEAGGILRNTANIINASATVQLRKDKQGD